jgi:putative tricarboxylic transport membrane protein
MPVFRPRNAASGGVALCVLLAAGSAPAQWKPEKRVELVIGTGAGGALDLTARNLQRIWSEAGIVTVPTVVVNKPGGGQSLALSYLNQQGGEGLHLSVVSGIIFSNHITGKSPHAYTDFTPVAVLFSEPTVFAVAGASPVAGAKDLLARTRQDPYRMSYAVGSTLGSSTHIAVALVAKAAGADIRKIRSVVFNSSGESVTAVLGGHVDVIVAAAQLVVQHSQAGRLKSIAVASAQRLPDRLADVPTWKELGVDAVVPNWRGVIGPRDMKPEQVAYWGRALARAVESAEWKAEAGKAYMESTFFTGPDAKAFLDADHAKTKSILTDLGMAKS